MEQARKWLEDETDSSSSYSDFVPEEVQVALFIQISATPSVLLDELFPLLLARLSSATAAQEAGSEEEAYSRCRLLIKLAVAIAVRCRNCSSSVLLELHELLTAPPSSSTTITTASTRLLLQSEVSFLEMLGNCSSSAAYPLFVRPSGIPASLWQRKSSKPLPIMRRLVVWGTRNELSIDALGLIFAFLTPMELCRAVQVCSFWCQAERAAQTALWDRLLVYTWPGTIGLGGGKQRYFKRLEMKRKRPAPRLGKRLASAVAYCPRCDAILASTAFLPRHVCKKDSFRTTKQTKQSARKRTKMATTE